MYMYFFDIMKVKLGTRCSPSMVIKIIEKLSEEQRRGVEEIGLGGC